MLDQIESVLAKDSVINIVPIVHMWDTLYQELNGRLNSHKERKEKSSKRQCVAETIDEKEEYTYELCGDGAPDELSKHHFGTSMG